jgi:hypothetical protein
VAPSDLFVVFDDSSKSTLSIKDILKESSKTTNKSEGATASNNELDAAIQKAK